MSALLALREDRGLIEVRGADRVRWLDGMVSNDVGGLDPAGPRSGCAALLLTPQGRIVADLHVWSLPDALLLELERAAIPAVLERLARYVIADDVELADAGDARARIGLEGEGAARVLERALGTSLALEPEAVAEAALAGAPVLVAAYGLASPGGRQLALAPGDVGAVREALLGAGARAAGPDELEVLRVESGIPRLGRELGEEVLPAEARLERAVSVSKGCYTGQEVVARMRSRGRVAHLLVGLAFEGEPPGEGAALERDGRRLGEVTSAARSARFGAIGLGYVSAAASEPGTRLRAGAAEARIVPLPFAGPAGEAGEAGGTREAGA